MFVNVKVFNGAKLVYEINPYDATVGTLKGLPAPQPAAGRQRSLHGPAGLRGQGSSTITGEDKTFHFALTTARYKDNRIPPLGFNASRRGWSSRSGTAVGAALLHHGRVRGRLRRRLAQSRRARRSRVTLYYQTTSREYIEFLRDEINGTGHDAPPGLHRTDRSVLHEAEGLGRHHLPALGTQQRQGRRQALPDDPGDLVCTVASYYLKSQSPQGMVHYRGKTRDVHEIMIPVPSLSDTSTDRIERIQVKESGHCTAYTESEIRELTRTTGSIPVTIVSAATFGRGK